jgi:uncharacterized protein (DUF885 family)
VNAIVTTPIPPSPEMKPSIIFKALLLGALLLVLPACWAPLSSDGPNNQRIYGTEESRRLDELLEGYFEELLRLNPVFATSVGDHRYDDQLGDGLTDEHRERVRLLVRRYTEALSRVERERLSPPERLSYDIFERHLTLHLEGAQFPRHLLPIRQLYSTPIEFPLLGSGSGIHPFRTVRDYENFLGRIDGFHTWADNAIANMRRGIREGIVQSKVVIERTLPQLEAMLVADVRQSLFYQPILRMPASFSEADRSRLEAAYAQAIEWHILPTYKKLYTFLKEEYLPRTRTTVALSELPSGGAWYAHLVKLRTTTDLKPDEIFEIGVKEINRIKGEMESL